MIFPITFVGDVHGKFDKFEHILQDNLNSRIVQVGDLGVGFKDTTVLNKYTNWQFIHGNHDNPDTCAKMPQFLGRYGFTGEFFYVSGAYSIDKQYRIVGRDWWDNEELSYTEGAAAINAYNYVKPNIMVTHDCPIEAYGHFFSHHSDVVNSKTTFMLQTMFEINQPKLWIFGHHHISKQFRIGNTNFMCLKELETWTYHN